MTNNGRYVSIKRVIEMVYRDYPVKGQLDFYDCMEWVGSLIAIIGSPNRLEKTVAVLKVEDGRAKLPCDVHSIVQCGRRFDYPTPLGLVPSTFFIENDVVEEDEVYTSDDSTVVVVNNPQRDAYWLEPMRYTGDTSIMRYHCCDIDFNVNRECGNTYTLNKNYMFTNFEKGQVEMFYMRIPVDDEGYPLIPDDESWLQAAKWEIISRLASKDWFAGTIDKARYDEAQWQRDWYLGQAAIDDPTIDEMEQWASYMQDPLRDARPHDAFFAHMSEPAHFRNVRR